MATIKVDAKMTVKVFTTLLQAKFQAFHWETMPQAQALQYMEDLKNDLGTYYNKFRVRSTHYDNQPNLRKP